ncbi:MAG: Uma2 family endonuclease [Acidobacteriaceae bacterium]|nr:Uma2 family endonuclease [Acidobacteriaceae bacterium]MBV9499741.1 Uma2 family endonuclease [Acidobacteriaceae bacterium]
MSAAPQLVTLAEYLDTEYEPDCDYVDGVLEERNVGKRRHSMTQGLLSSRLLAESGKHGCDVLVEQRVQISRSRVRIPDVCLVSKDNEAEVTQRPPLLWIEVLSPEDRWSRIQPRRDDALRFGVGTIWIVDPYLKAAWIARLQGGTVPVTDGVLRCAAPKFEIPLTEVLPE